MKRLVTLMAVVLLLLGTANIAAADFFIDFENGLGHNFELMIADDVAGLNFGNLMYGDSTAGVWNTKSIDLAQSWNAGLYQHYGYVFGHPAGEGSATIDFINDDATWFQIGYTSDSDFYLEGYDIYGNPIAQVSGAGNRDGDDMGWLRIDAPAGQAFDYAIIHDGFGQWVVDNMSGNASGVNPVPEPCTLLLLGSGLAGVVALKRRKKS